MTGQILIQFPLLCHVLHLHLLAHLRISIRCNACNERERERRERKEGEKKEGQRKREKFRQRDISAIIIPREIIIPAIKWHRTKEKKEKKMKPLLDNSKPGMADIAPFFQ